MTLFGMWESHYMKGTLPPEWLIWEDFRRWSIENNYKTEYGYKGEFSPQGCLKAMPGYADPGETQENSAENPDENPGDTSTSSDAEISTTETPSEGNVQLSSHSALAKMKISELKEIAEGMKIDLARARARTKEQIIAVIEGVSAGIWKYDDEREVKD